MPHPRQIQVSISYICPALNLPFKFFHYYIYCPHTRHCWCRIITKLLWHFFLWHMCTLQKYCKRILSAQWTTLMTITSLHYTTHKPGKTYFSRWLITHLLWLGSYFPVFGEMIINTLYFNWRVKAKETPACKNATFYWHVVNLL